MYKSRLDLRGQMPAEPIIASIHVEAPPEQVFAYFTEAEAMVRWMGHYALLDPIPGGELAVDINAVPVRGH